MSRTLPELVAGLHPVTPETEWQVREYAAAFYALTDRPRYFLSPGYLAAQPSVFTMGVVDDCLVLLKRRYIVGNRVMYLVMPPIHVDGDAQAERRVIEEFRALHVSTMLSAEDLERYEYGPREAALDKRWPEFSYRSSAWWDLAGRDNRQARNALNLAYRLDAAGAVKVVSGLMGFTWDLEDLARRWHSQKGLDVHQARLVRTLQDHARRGPLRRCANVVLDTSHGAWRVVAHSLTEEVVPGQVVIVSRIRDYEWQGHPDPVLLLHVMDCKYWQGVTGEPVVLTSGSARNPGLMGHKAKLRPEWVTPVGRLTTARALTKEEYEAAVPGGGLPEPAPPDQLELGF